MFIMSSESPIESTVLVNVNPRAHDAKLLVKKDPKTLDDLRSSFSKQPCSVLGQVRDFLPKMASANTELHQKLAADPAFCPDIEKMGEDSPHIEMNIAMFEQGDGDSESCESSDEGETTIGAVTEQNIKLPKTEKHVKGDKHGPFIECIGDNDVPLKKAAQSKADKTEEFGAT